MVDGEALVMTMAMILPKFPVPARCQNGVSGSKSQLLVVAAQRNSFWKNDERPSVSVSEAIYRRKRRPRGCLGRSVHPLARARPSRTARWYGRA